MSAWQAIQLRCRVIVVDHVTGRVTLASDGAPRPFNIRCPKQLRDELAHPSIEQADLDMFVLREASGHIALGDVVGVRLAASSMRAAWRGLHLFAETRGAP